MNWRSITASFCSNGFPGGFILRRAEKKLLTYARETVRSFELLEEAMRKDRMVDHLNIGASITVGNCLLSQIISQLQTLKPELGAVYPRWGNTTEIQENLLNSSLDIALVEGMITHQDLVSIPVVEDFLVPCLLPLSSLCLPENHHLPGTEQSALRSSRTGKRHAGTVRPHAAEQRKYIYKIACEANTPQAIRNMVMYNNCLTVISIRLIDDEVRNGKIHVIRNSTREWDRSFFLVTHKNKTFTPAMQLLRELSETVSPPGAPGRHPLRTASALKPGEVFCFSVRFTGQLLFSRVNQNATPFS